MKIGPHLVGSVWLICLSECHPSAPATPPNDPDRITQVSVINALMLGQYDGVMPIAELLRQGAIGVGTLDHLDGEMIVLDGQAYQVRGDKLSWRGDQGCCPWAVNCIRRLALDPAALGARDLIKLTPSVMWDDHGPRSPPGDSIPMIVGRLVD